jgi:hypothetical protein
LQQAAKVALSALLTAGGLIGFVAFAGSVIVWTRLQAAGVPPEQAVAAFPRSQLVSVGAALLLLFGFFGALSAIAVYLVDRGGRATPGVIRALLLLVAAEGATVVILVNGPSVLRTIVAIECFMLPMGTILLATFVTPWVSVENNLPARNEDEDEIRPERLLEAPERLRDVISRKMASGCLAGALAAVLLALVMDSAFSWGTNRLQLSIAVALGVLGVFPAVVLLVRWARNDGPGGKGDSHPPAEIKPQRIQLRHQGLLVASAAAIIAIVLPSLWLGQIWLAVSLATAMVLGAGLWRIAGLSNASYLWLGLALFISVPLFGTLTTMARDIEDPQVQPMVLIRSGDSPSETIQGLYVTESDDRIYFATLSTEGCSRSITPHSGRLLWVPRDEVVALSIGPLQNVDDAARSALEMSHAMTAATAASGLRLRTSQPSTDSEGPTPGRDSEGPVQRRLEETGDAVNPDFGAGLSLSPEIAAPGAAVTLRMNQPKRDSGQHGFGRSREHRSLMIGGVPADILKEQAREPWEAEFLETEQGTAVSLEKGVVYTRSEEGYAPVDQASTPVGELFVRVSDPEVLSVNDHHLASGNFLRITDEGGTAADLLPAETHRGRGAGRAPVLSMRDGTQVTLKPRLLRQAWKEDQIEFRVPATAHSGPVTVECEQLAGQPLLQVAESPHARISVSIEPGSEQVVFDSSHSSDRSDKIVSRRWRIEGLDAGNETRIAQNLPASLQSYSVRLIVTDAGGRLGTAELHMLRLPSRLVALDAHGHPLHPRARDRAELAVRNLMAGAAAETAQNVEFDARPAARSAAHLGAGLELRQAEMIRDASLNSARPARISTAEATANGLTVKTHAFGRECPAEQSSVDGRLDVLVLSQGVHTVSTPRCTPVRSSTGRWLLAPP